MSRLLYILFIVTCWSCTDSYETEKLQNTRNTIINVREKLQKIEIEDVLIGGVNRLQLLGDYLIIGDYSSYDQLIHIFNKKDFSYVTSTAARGEGPYEITNMGHIGIDEVHRKFYVSDHGKQKIFSYDLDSVLVNKSYVPQVKAKMDEKLFPDKYQYISDTLCIGRVIEPIGNNDFKPFVATWNMHTGKIELMKYEHSKIEKKRMVFAVSMEYGIYIECYCNHDLMTICNLDGNLKYNIYGPNWGDQRSRNIDYYGNALFCNDKILVSFSGKDAFYKSENGEMRSNLPTKLLAFNINGDYLKTLETEYMISDFCYDKESNKLIISLDDPMMQFAYLDLGGLVEEKMLNNTQQNK